MSCTLYKLMKGALNDTTVSPTKGFRNTESDPASNPKITIGCKFN